MTEKIILEKTMPESDIQRNNFRLNEQILSISVDFQEHFLKGNCQMKFLPTAPLDFYMNLHKDFTLQVSSKQLKIISVKFNEEIAKCEGKTLEYQAYLNYKDFHEIRDFDSLNLLHRVFL